MAPTPRRVVGCWSLMPKRRVRWEPNATACTLPSDGLPLSIVIPTVGGESQRRRNLARLLHTLLAMSSGSASG